MANLNAEPEDKSLTENQQKKVKKPYTKPSFRFEQVFVTSALSCGKVQLTEFGCSTNRKVS